MIQPLHGPAAILGALALGACNEEGPRLHDPPGYAAIAEAMTLPGGHLIAVGQRRLAQGGAVLHFDGETWNLLDGGSLPGAIHQVWAASPDSIWIAGDGPDQTKLRHWDGATWLALDEDILGDGARFESVRDIWGSSSDDVWVLGDPGGGRALYHWDGAQWSMRDVPRPAEVPAGDSFGLTGLGCSSALDDVWLLASSQEQETASEQITDWSMHWDGTSWDASRFGDIGGQNVMSIACRGAQRWVTTLLEGDWFLYQGASAGWTRILYSHVLDFVDVAIESEDRALVTGLDRPDSGPLVWSIGADERTDDPSPELRNVLPDGMLQGTPTAITTEIDGTMWVFDDVGNILEVP